MEEKVIDVFKGDVGREIVRGLARRLICDASCYNSETIGELIALTWEALVDIGEESSK